MAPAAVVVVVVVAGLVAAAGLVTGAVVVLAGAVAGLVAVVGGTTGGLFGGGWLAGGGWPKELKAMVTEKRLAISVVFIELIGKLFPTADSDRVGYPRKGNQR